jgi:hypothetical protein
MVPIQDGVPQQNTTQINFLDILNHGVLVYCINKETGVKTAFHSWIDSQKNLMIFRFGILLMIELTRYLLIWTVK